jgi:NADH-quinone oxidoreductase subunit H
MNTASAVIVTMFLGGYQLPWVGTETLLEHFRSFGWGVMVVLPIVMALFIGWMRRNNRVRPTVATDGGRQRETRILTRVLIGVTLLLEGILLYLTLGGGSAAVAVPLLQIVIFIAKLMVVNLFFIVIRWTLPRFRYDQVQVLGWRYLLPLALLNLFVTALVITGGAA